MAENVPQAALQTLATAAVAAWRTLVTTAAMGFSTQVSLSGVTVRSLDQRGLTTTQAEAAPATAGAGTSSLTLPNQCAVVVTLKTARAGRTGKGRIYLPLLAITIDGSGKIPTDSQTSIVTGVKTLIDSLNTALGALTPNTAKVAVQSRSETSQDIGYTGAAVTSVSVGNIIDTQRRRRASLVESYISATIA